MTSASVTAVKREKKSSMWSQAFWRVLKDRAAMVGLIGLALMILACIAAPLLTPYSPTYMDLFNIKSPPTWAHPFGTDTLGRDYLARILYGGRYSLGLGLSSSLISLIVGTILGMIAGYFGGVVDDVISRICDIVQAIPSLLFCIIMAMLLGSGYAVTILALGVGGIANQIRLPRGQMFAIRKLEYLDAATVSNCSIPRILFRHALPNILSPLLVNFTMGIGSQVQAAASLSILGLGVPPSTPEWGAMLSDSLGYIQNFPHLMIFPALMIFLLTLLVNMFGDGLRDALDPKLKR